MGDSLFDPSLNIDCIVEPFIHTSGAGHLVISMERVGTNRTTLAVRRTKTQECDRLKHVGGLVEGQTTKVLKNGKGGTKQCGKLRRGSLLVGSFCLFVFVRLGNNAAISKKIEVAEATVQLASYMNCQGACQLAGRNFPSYRGLGSRQPMFASRWQ
jgi:hypothetical protein